MTNVTPKFEALSGNRCETLTAKTLTGAKRQASALLSHGCGDMVLYKDDEPIARRRFWEGFNTFGWGNWEDYR